MSGATLAAQPQRLTLRRPDDWHVHLRDGALLRAVVGHTARQFARAIVMPNLRPPTASGSSRPWRPAPVSGPPHGSRR